MHINPLLRSAVAALVGFASITCTSALADDGLVAPAAEEPDDLSQQAFAGVYIRDLTDSPDCPYCLATWILPGPFGGTGFDSQYVNRGDAILTANGEPRTADQFKSLIESLSPGATLHITAKRGTGDIRITAADLESLETETFEFDVTLGSRAEWVGTIDRPRPGRVLPEPTPSAVDSLLMSHAVQHGIEAGVNELLDYFRETQEEHLGYHALNRVVAGFMRPLSVDSIEETIVAEAAAVPAAPFAHSLSMAAANLNIPWHADEPAAVTVQGVDALAAQLHGQLEQARTLGAASIIDDRLAQQAMQLVSLMATSVYIYDEHSREHIEVMRRSMDVDYESVLRQARALAVDINAVGLEDAAPLATLDETIENAVEGDVLYVGRDADGLVIIGGPGDNTYHMDAIAAVYDVGGNDTYVYEAPRVRRSTLIIDVSGDDRYESESAFAGPAAAVVGASVIDDRSGNDIYEGTRFSCAAGLFGVGLLVDHAGNDVYRGEDWSQGVGFYGTGLLIDLGGSDAYLGEMRVQGIGGPRGFGAIIDANGNDLYRANGPHGSVYGTPAVFAGFSQGFGYGIRQYSAGGIGLISDLAGHDRYEAGEFSQGGGYYWAMGILHDHDGDDLYYGNRYGQGFGCHQSIGILADDAGNDTYWTMTAADQGGSWDIGVGLLIDRTGNDAYRADGLSQGSASQQAIGLLVDLAGQDRYTARGRTQGLGGGNRYHYTTSRCFSFNALIDAGPEHDFYSTGRPNDTVITTGELNEEHPEDSSIYGLFIDGIAW
ncbi:MAG: hypothetical protein KAS72_06020 [Phycisphaerales bacterium]|nr:hypothetical protein [Phycisphaerales bacterium]